MSSAPTKVKLGLIQTHASADPADNLARTLDLAGQAADRGAQIVCTQERLRSE